MTSVIYRSGRDGTITGRSLWTGITDTSIGTPCARHTARERSNGGGVRRDGCGEGADECEEGGGVSAPASAQQRIVRILGRTLQVLHVVLLLFLVYQIVAAHTVPSQSEWLTADAFVPGMILGILLYAFCFLVTQWVIMFARHRLAALRLVPIAAPTLAPYALLLLESIRTMGT